MNAATISVVSLPSSTSATDWNWRAELKSLDAAIEHVAAGESWDWRRELLEIEAALDKLAARHGLQATG